MQNYRHQWRIGCMAVVILLLASGCFQAAGTGPNDLSVAENTNPTWTPSPFPTSEPLVVTQSVIVTATLDPFAVQPPPDTGFPTQDFSAQVQQDTTGLDPIYVTATFIVARATEQEAINQTMTAAPPFATPTPTLGGFQPTFTPTFVPGTGGTCTHTVVAGDNLFRIAMQYNTTIDAIAQANGIANPNIIVVGDVLTIPNCGSSSGGSTGGSTGGTGGSTGSGTTYTVQQGDTLYKISLQYGVPVMSIAAANNIANINLIHINDQLIIPPA